MIVFTLNEKKNKSVIYTWIDLYHFSLANADFLLNCIIENKYYNNWVVLLDKSAHLNPYFSIMFFFAFVNFRCNSVIFITNLY